MLPSTTAPGCHGASNSPEASSPPAEDSDDDGLAPDVLAAAAMQARDFAALQAHQQGMFPGLAFFLVRLTSDWSKTYHEYVDSRSLSWGNHGVHVHDVGQRVRAGSTGCVISQRTTQVLLVRWIRVMSLLLQWHVPYALCLPLGISFTQLGQRSITVGPCWTFFRQRRLHRQRRPLQCLAHCSSCPCIYQHPWFRPTQSSPARCNNLH
jgi:hypothetical protein